MIKQTLIFLATVLAGFVVSGCASFEEGSRQNVQVLSFPSGANLFVNGAPMGTTPATLSLPRKIAHEVRLEKPGYATAIDYFKPVPNTKGESFLRFGLEEDLGHYVDLQPRSMQLQLRSELVPHSTGADPFKTMAEHTREADRQLEAGNITAEEHKYIIEQIIAFFEAQG
ncbi:MAG: PEGA domain-containing protein [Opitutales bacterium]|jgi:hypothetical protein